ncbi:MAG: hypothetical protein ACD_66C00050G0003 [uncultured bacterium]|uniref:Uncharacterized protein n=1 Tax=Candidatus Gottesmanbacteria bacterium GW2011_GWB1_43_11 TaxID=1618446 RepID=A0A0G1CLW4_9BACT|nr:MAG: hypothetical protein ACD_66C00050G0003 [uncultured bacterium]KKS41585.1 MAG: hypothetical protein UV04_C0006G0008 [Candidatus Gottesmanbacteria bacterium GW2011_GWA2_42_16]KKS55867.1 MAG: hypothetical protein UV17_C0006G0024 [Candidatus Gottesmanbacteria bacterium GW2011_GWA1_42_26]KKS81268.1 MAG: hypothetical protein UV55_C0017G0025 [Candidatus Gottesmanbacteria bacterium GW2011_GWC1_43_10]KKS86750.1 MAG: hypothetical protein UV61_C0007G0008 [Candidatus Gottesmanbacteria bacterium GW20
MNLEDEIDELRAKIRDYLTNSLNAGHITLDEAKKIAQFTAENLTYTLPTIEDVKKVMDKMEQEFPAHAPLIKAFYLSEELNEARKTADTEVLRLIAEGKLTEALDLLNKYGLK